MSKYAQIDAAILDALSGEPCAFNQLYRGSVLRLLRTLSGSADTVLHSRLCALKKQGRIEYKDKTWHMLQVKVYD